MPPANPPLPDRILRLRCDHMLTSPAVYAAAGYSVPRLLHTPASDFPSHPLHGDVSHRSPPAAPFSSVPGYRPASVLHPSCRYGPGSPLSAPAILRHMPSPRKTMPESDFSEKTLPAVAPHLFRQTPDSLSLFSYPVSPRSHHTAVDLPGLGISDKYCSKHIYLQITQFF